MNPYIFRTPIDVCNINQLSKILCEHYKYIDLHHPLYNTFCLYKGTKQSLFNDWLIYQEFLISNKLFYINDKLELYDIYGLLAFKSICDYQDQYPMIYYDAQYRISDFINNNK